MALSLAVLGVGVADRPGCRAVGRRRRRGLARGFHEAARATVGRDADAQVKLALWCEAHGLSAERAKHLALAVLNDPTNATARGLMGLVEYGGRWQRPDAVAAKVKADEALTAKLAEYNARRAKAAARPPTIRRSSPTGARQEQPPARDGRAPRSDRHPARPDERVGVDRWLGYKKHGGRWVTDAQVAAERAEAEAQKKADRHWKPLLTKWKTWVGEKASDTAHETVAAPSAGVSDPRAVPSVWAVFAASKDAEVPGARTSNCFGRIDAPDASRALAVLAVYARPAEVRRAAAETLARRDRREYLDALIAALGRPGQVRSEAGRRPRFSGSPH